MNRKLSPLIKIDWKKSLKVRTVVSIVGIGDRTKSRSIIDGQNRRVGKKVNGTLARRWPYHDQLRPAAELDENGGVARFVYGTGWTPNYMVKDKEIYRLLVEYLGSARTIVNANTGQVAQQIDYDDWGKVTPGISPGFQAFGFAGGDLANNQTGRTCGSKVRYDSANECRKMCRDGLDSGGLEVLPPANWWH